ncbi:Mitotic spindle checkpoint component mad2, partial [Entomortierella lignicola]
MTKKYGLNMLVTTDPQVKSHMREILKQVEAWLMACKVEKLILAIKSKETMTVLERWQFDIQNTKDHHATLNSTSSPSSQNQNKENLGFYSNDTDSAAVSAGPTNQKTEKTEKEIQTEIQAILRQITASVTFLPMLDEK